MTQTTPLPSPSSFTCDWIYDVFLNFRGVDTRYNFTGNLYNSLHQKGIHTFIDDEGLNRGEEITPALRRAIRESRIFISVFSKNYASSTHCLDELVMILECLKAQGRLFMPVFYDVDPSQVRHQTGNYAQDMAKHEEMFPDDKDKVQKWREALSQAASMSGWHFQHGIQEYTFIGKIIEEVSKRINRIPLHVTNNPVGLESPVQEVTALLELGSNKGVNMVGMYGIGGIGKSTIARAVYNLIGDQFEGLCFLADIKDKATKHGLAHLQETLLYEILGEKDIKVGDIYKGISIIKNRLRRKKVLLILDDIDKLNQLEVLAGEHNWFGFGSKIIITTRRKHLLASHKSVKFYEVKQLNDEKALEFFSLHAFKSNKVDPNYEGISRRAVVYARGLPLALKVIGSHLFGKSLAVCKCALDRYERIVHKDILEILKVSYDDLEEDVQRIFLDIACFFNSYKIHYLKEILYIRGFYVEDGIQVLIDNSLIKIDHNDCIVMHDLIQDMGREIVRQEAKFEPGKRSRLWFDEDVINVLEKNMGTDTVEVIIIDLFRVQKVQWTGMAFEKMKNLRILIIENAHLSIGPLNLPNSLRVLDWSGYPSPSLPSDFNPKHLAILSLHESCFKSFQVHKVFESLNFMDFDGCQFLIELPCLSGVPNLGALCLDNCTNLVRISRSTGFLKRLIFLSAQGCTKLEILVPYINLASLETLNMRGCSRLKSFPEVSGIMKNIKEICLDHTAITELPFSIENLIGLQRLFIRGCLLIQLPSSIHLLPTLEIIMAYGCRGFKFSKDEERVRSKVFPMAMHVYEGGSKVDHLDVCFHNIRPNSIIEPVSRYSLEFHCLMSDPILLKKVSKKSPMRFWFRKKFPTITLCCVGEAGYEDNMVLEFKFSVFINGTKQFSSWSNYIISRQMKTTEQNLFCHLRCKEEKEFENYWNEVDISCELQYHMLLRDLETVPTTENGIRMRKPKSSFIHVYEEHMENVTFSPQFCQLVSQNVEPILTLPPGLILKSDLPKSHSNILP